MSRIKAVRFIFIAVLLVAFVLPSASVSAASRPNPRRPITSIGHPIWKPVDFHLFSAPIGTAADGYAEFYEIMGQILPPPDHIHYDTLGPGGIGPGAPHQPPYNTEIANGLSRLGYHQGVEFSRSEFSNGMGINIAWMTVANPGVTGSSPNFTHGPVIPNTLFPIKIYGVSYHNNKLFRPIPGGCFCAGFSGHRPKVCGSGRSQPFPHVGRR